MITSFKEIFHQILAALPVNFNEFMIGIGYGWIAPILVRLQTTDNNYVSPSVEESSWIASIHEVGRTLGPIFAALFLDNIGRKNTITICAFLFFATWFTIIFARTITLVYVTRVLFGMSVGMNDVSSSIYLAENCSPNIRGIISSFIPLSLYAGIFLEYILATYLSYASVAIVNTLLSLLTLASVFRLKETPYFLMMKGRNEAAENTLVWLKGNGARNEDVVMELDKIKQNIQTEKTKKSSFVALFTSPENYKSVSIILIIYALTMGTGYSAINSYASIVLPASGNFTSGEFTILLGIVQFLCVCLSPFMMEKYNRRTLILISFLTMAICNVSASALYYIQRINITIPYYPWFIFASVTIYSSIFAAVYPAVFILRGELLPTSVRAVGGSLGIVVHSLVGFATARLFLTITNSYGIHVNFLIYGVVSLMAFTYIYFILPETRGKSLTDIQKAFKNI